MTKKQISFLLPKRENTMTDTITDSIPQSLISKLDKIPVEAIETYTTERKIKGAYITLSEQLECLNEDQAGTVIALLNRAYLDGHYDDDEATSNHEC